MADDPFSGDVLKLEKDNPNDKQRKLIEDRIERLEKFQEMTSLIAAHLRERLK